MTVNRRNYVINKTRITNVARRLIVRMEVRKGYQNVIETSCSMNLDVLVVSRMQHGINNTNTAFN